MEENEMSRELDQYQNTVMLMRNARRTDELMATLRQITRRLFEVHKATPEHSHAHHVYLQAAQLLFDLGGMTGAPFEEALKEWEAGQLMNGYPQDAASYPRRPGP